MMTFTDQRDRVRLVVLTLKALGQWEKFLELFSTYPVPSVAAVRRLYWAYQVGFTGAGELYVSDCEVWSATLVGGEWVED